MAEIHITKLVAARRQLQAAIRMFFAGEDELAVHTVASAAYSLIKDIKRSRGRDEVADVYSAMLFYNVRDYRRGTLPRNLADNAEYMKHVREWAEALPSITKNSKYEDLGVTIPREVVRRFWKGRNKVFNFLKHADDDSDKHISQEEIKNYELLIQASASYQGLEGTLGAEGEILLLYSDMRSGENEVLPAERLGDIGRLTGDEQLRFFSDWLTEPKRERGEI